LAKFKGYVAKRFEREIRVSVYEEAPGFRLGPRVAKRIESNWSNL